MAQENESQFLDAIHKDLGKPRLETMLADLGSVVYAVSTAVEKLEEWAAPVKPEVPAWRASWDTTTYRTPKGAVLIIAYVRLILIKRKILNGGHYF
jgi:aldehyde dehydrogenase (NAD+)